MSRMLLVVCLAASVSMMLACGSSEPAVNSETNSSAAKPATASSPAAASTPATSSSGTMSADSVGVPVCDEFIAKYDACVTGKVPAEARAQYQTALSQWRTQWKRMAETPQMKSALEQACRTAMDQAKAQLKTYDCAF